MVLDALRARGAEHGLDHDLLWNGYLYEYTSEAVSKALQRLKRRGLIETAGKRGWWIARRWLDGITK